MSHFPPPVYSNITLTSLGGDLSVVVYLPIGVHADGKRRHDEEDLSEPFYYSSRFDHGSMIGTITRTKASSPRWPPEQHVLFGTDTWRLPHNSHWPESGVGLASEFGVGDDGSLCDFRCGWPAAVGVTNGLLGYQEANNGGSFLKIGVGELVKGTCPACDSTDDYRFNSPYMFAKRPEWTLTRGADNAAVVLEHQAVLHNHGYALKKEILLQDSTLSVTTTLQNLGDTPFSTAWYAHNFFTCDKVAVGPGYSLDLDIKGDGLEPLYDEPAAWSWSTPLTDFADVKSYPNSVHVRMTRALEPGTRIKAEYADDHATTGGFTLRACETSVESTLLSADLRRDDANSPLQMYAYGLFVERGTFSPEPQLLINNLGPGASVSWTQVLVIHDDGFESEAQSPLVQNSVAAASVPISTAVAAVRPWWNLRGVAGPPQQSSSYVDTTLVTQAGVAAALGCCCMLVLLLHAAGSRYRRRRNYEDLS